MSKPSLKPPVPTLTKPQATALGVIAHCSRLAVGYATWSNVKGAKVQVMVVYRLIGLGLVKAETFESFGGKLVTTLKITDLGRDALRADRRKRK